MSKIGESWISRMLIVDRMSFGDPPLNTCSYSLRELWGQSCQALHPPSEAAATPEVRASKRRVREAAPPFGRAEGC